MSLGYLLKAVVRYERSDHSITKGLNLIIPEIESVRKGGGGEGRMMEFGA